MSFTDEQLELLAQPIPPEQVQTHTNERGEELSYVSATYVEQQMNAIFSPRGWSRTYGELILTEVAGGTLAMRTCTVVVDGAAAPLSDYYAWMLSTNPEDATQEVMASGALAFNRTVRVLGKAVGHGLYEDAPPSAPVAVPPPPPSPTPAPASDPAPSASGAEPAVNGSTAPDDAPPPRRQFTQADDARASRREPEQPLAAPPPSPSDDEGDGGPSFRTLQGRYEQDVMEHLPDGSPNVGMVVFLVSNALFGKGPGDIEGSQRAALMGVPVERVLQVVAESKSRHGR